MKILFYLVRYLARVIAAKTEYTFVALIWKQQTLATDNTFNVNNAKDKTWK